MFNLISSDQYSFLHFWHSNIHAVREFHDVAVTLLELLH